MSALANRRRAASASQRDVAEVVLAALSHGNALDAVLAGVFAAAALESSVLLGPLQLMIGGAGAGLRAVDGRNRQPGLKLPRPRGFVSADEIAPAARVAVPALPAAIAAALATHGSSTLSRIAAPAIELAKARSAPRAKVLDWIARHGGTGLVDPWISGELIAAAGRIAGGLLGPSDLEEVRPEVAECSRERVGERYAMTVPWGAEAVRDPAEDALDATGVEIIAATDGRGFVAIACYRIAGEGVAVSELGLVAPFTAVPVRRGETRVRPGEPRPAAAPIALSEAEGIVDLALAVSGVESAEQSLGEIMRRLGEGVLLETAASESEGTLRGVGRTRDAARVIAEAAGVRR